MTLASEEKLIELRVNAIQHDKKLEIAEVNQSSNVFTHTHDLLTCSSYGLLQQ